MKSTQILKLLTFLTVSQASGEKVLDNNVKPELQHAINEGEAQAVNFEAAAIIKLPDEVKEAIDPPSIVERGWEELEWILFGEPFEYDLNTPNRTLEDIAKLHILNANSGKFYGNNYTAHTMKYDGNISTVAYDDFVYLYYGSKENSDILTLDYDIPFYTNGIAPGKPTPAPEA